LPWRKLLSSALEYWSYQEVWTTAALLKSKESAERFNFVRLQAGATEDGNVVNESIAILIGGPEKGVIVTALKDTAVVLATTKISRPWIGWFPEEFAMPC
jgi:D-mannonate dehydratase